MSTSLPPLRYQSQINLLNSYSFPAVTLAYFLRYPNQYSKHVISTDVLDRHFDPSTQRLHSTRLHLKRSKIPSAVLRFLPKSVLGSTNNNAGQSYILEKTVVDVKEGWMKTETKNLEWTGILSVVEKQHYERRPVRNFDAASGSSEAALDMSAEGRTDVKTMVSFESRFGQTRLLSKRTKPASKSLAEDDEEQAPKRGLFATWSSASIQRSIELVGVRRTGDHFTKSTEGMKLVLERLRIGGVVNVLEGMKRDRDSILIGAHLPWKRKVEQSRHDEMIDQLLEDE